MSRKRAWGSRKRAWGQEKEPGGQEKEPGANKKSMGFSLFLKMDSHRDLTIVSHFLRQKIASSSL
jgi:hypothetical protein